MKELHKAKTTANMAMVTDANGQPTASDKITKTELNMLNNVRSNIQTQIDSKVSTDSTWGMPDYANRVSMSLGETIVPVNAVGYVGKTYTDEGTLTVTVDGVEVYSNGSGSSSNYASSQFLIPAGSTVKIVKTGDSGLRVSYYAPLKTS